MRTSWFAVGGLMAAAAVGLAMASAPAPTVPPATASTRGDSSAAAAYAAQLGLTAAVGLPYKAITFAIHQFSYLVWVSKLQLFNAVSVAFQTAVGITLPLVATAVVNGVIKGVEKKISGEDMGKMAKIVEKVLKKFEENRPGLFPAGVDFAALAKKVVEESVPKPAKKGGKPAPARPKASLDDYSPELRAMLGFDPEEEAAARALIAKEVMREAETAAMKDSSSGQRAMFLPTEQLGLVKGGDRRRSQVQGILDLIDAVMIQELVGQVYGSRPRPSYAPPPPAYAPPPTSSTYAPSTYAPPPPSSTYAPPPNSTYEVPSSTYAPPPSTYAPPPPPSTYAPPEQPTYAPPPPPSTYAPPPPPSTYAPPPPSTYAPPPPPSTYAPPPPSTYAPPPPPSTYAPPPQPAYAPPPPPPAYAIQGAAAPVATRQACGRDFSFGGKSYLFSWASGGGARADWASARAACRACGMDLVSLESAAENEAVKAMIDAAWRQGVIQYSWTGGQRTGGGWSWVSGQPIALPGQGFHNWGIDQPDNVERNEDCIAFLNPTVHNDPSGQMTWNDVACYYQKPYVCEG